MGRANRSGRGQSSKHSNITLVGSTYRLSVVRSRPLGVVVVDPSSIHVLIETYMFGQYWSRASCQTTEALSELLFEELMSQHDLCPIPRNSRRTGRFLLIGPPGQRLRSAMMPALSSFGAVRS